MKDAAIIVVPSDWHVEDPIAVSQSLYDNYKDVMEAGMYFAVMQADPANRIVAQAELASPGHPADVSEWDEALKGKPPQDAAGNPAAYVLPTRVLYHYDDALSVPAKEVAERVEDFEALQQEGFLVIDEDTYNALFDRYIENE